MVLVGCHFKQVVREDCTEEVGSEQKPEGAEEGGGKHCRRREQQCKGPEVGPCLESQRNSELTLS